MAQTCRYFFTNALLCLANFKTKILWFEIREICDNLQLVDNQQFGKSALVFPILSSAMTYRTAVRLNLNRTMTKVHSRDDEAQNAGREDNLRDVSDIFLFFRQVFSAKTWRIFL